MHSENKLNEDKQSTRTTQNLENIMTIKVTYGRNVSKPKDINIVAIGSIFDTIKHGITPDGMNFMGHIAAIRTNRSKEAVARIKASLPWFCASELKDSRKATSGIWPGFSSFGNYFGKGCDKRRYCCNAGGYRSVRLSYWESLYH